MDFRSPTDRGNLIAYVQGLEKRARKNPRSIEPPHPPAILQLPSWGKDVRCMPNEILRSALFNARNRNQPRRYFKNEDIALIDQSTRIRFSGEELRQNDESVWLQLIHLAKEVPLGNVTEFTAGSMLRALHLKKTRSSIDRLCESLRRMQATSLSIHSKRLASGASFSMIPKFEWQDETTGSQLDKWRVFIAPEMAALFGDVHFTRLLWEQRLALPSGLATWLHGYLATHSKPFPIKLATLQRGCGCATDNSHKFRQLTSTALAELMRVGFLKQGTIRGELIYTEREKLINL